jgi:hypothetical protein
MLNSALETSVSSDLDEQKKHAPNRPHHGQLGVTSQVARTLIPRRYQAGIQFEPCTHLHSSHDKHAA